MGSKFLALFLTLFFLLTVTVLVNPVRAAVSVPSSFAYYKLDEGSGDSLTDSSVGNTGTAVNASIVSGKLGNARLLNGSYLNLNNIAQFSNAQKLTVSIWVNLNSNSGQQALVTKFDSQGYWTDVSGGTPRIAFAPGAFISAKGMPLLPNIWYHIVWVFDGSNSNNADRLHLYIDGVSTPISLN